MVKLGYKFSDIQKLIKLQYANIFVSFIRAHLHVGLISRSRMRDFIGDFLGAIFEQRQIIGGLFEDEIPQLLVERRQVVQIHFQIVLLQIVFAFELVSVNVIEGSQVELTDEILEALFRGDAVDLVAAHLRGGVIVVAAKVVGEENPGVVETSHDFGLGDRKQEVETRDLKRGRRKFVKVVSFFFYQI